MSKFKIINLFDKLFISVSIFLIIYAWINFFIKNLWATFVLSLIFSSACIFLLFYFFNIHTLKNNKNKNYLKDIEEKFLAFRLLNKTAQINLIKNILISIHKTDITDETLVFEKEHKKCQVLLALEYEKLTDYSLVNLIAKRENDVEILQIVCNDFVPNLNTKILKDLQVEIISKKLLYDSFFTPSQIFPETSNLDKQNSKIKLCELMKNFFLPHKAKSYFLCGLILIFSSIILPYHTYYLIFGSLLLIFSIVCKLQSFFKR